MVWSTETIVSSSEQSVTALAGVVAAGWCLSSLRGFDACLGGCNFNVGVTIGRSGSTKAPLLARDWHRSFGVAGDGARRNSRDWF
jgi:hypothetical protein